MQRAIKDLCQLPDQKLFDEVATGIGHVLELVDELDVAAQELLRLGHYHAARILRNQAEEEAAKVLILVDAVRCSPARQKERFRTLGYFYEHLAKGIYVEVCKWRPIDFREVTQLIEGELIEQYLGGPTGVDWIFPNRIEQGREDDLYVGYVREDSTESDEEEHHHWVYPQRDDFDALLSRQTPPVIRTARALHRVGATTPAGLAIVAAVWRPVDVPPEMRRVDELEPLNRRTLELLEERTVLSAAADQDCAVVWCDWTFPLWPLNLKKRKVEKGALRRAQRNWWPLNC
jgi:hypothetical protein